MQPQAVSRFEVRNLGNRQSFACAFDVNVKLGALEIKARSVGMRQHRRYAHKNSQYEST
jgi:hypothetical protein